MTTAEKRVQIYRRQIERAKVHAEKGGRILTRWDVMHLQVQTAGSMGRGILIVAGLGFLGGASYLATERELSWGLLLLVLPGLALIVVGIRGRKREVEQVLNGMDGAITNSLLDGLF